MPEQGDRVKDEGLAARSQPQIIPCRGEGCDQKCCDHSAVLGFKKNTERDLTTIFKILEVLSPDVAKLSTYIKIGGSLACLLLLALCIMTAGSYVRLNTFIISHSAEEKDEAVVRGNIVVRVKQLEKEVDKLHIDIDNL